VDISDGTNPFSYVLEHNVGIVSCLDDDEEDQYGEHDESVWFH